MKKVFFVVAICVSLFASESQAGCRNRRGFVRRQPLRNIARVIAGVVSAPFRAASGRGCN